MKEATVTIIKDDHTKRMESMKTDPKDLERARQVLQTEIKGLQMLSETLDDEFSESVAMINAMRETGRGRLIVSGIGKSGHVARKVAATLASTATPSFYVHPGEASHGDLGMVTPDDIVLMLSNSGENAELSDLIHYTRRYDIPLIAMTSRRESALGRYADKIIMLPRAPEACPNGLAPTTSSTMMMAAGDALAVALLERMGLTPEGFKQFHPGGKLGKKLMKLADLAHTGQDLPRVGLDANMEEALLALTEKNLGCVLVVGDNESDLKGIITDGDLKRHMGPDLLTREAKDIMSINPKTIRHDALAVEAVNVMTKKEGQYLTSLVVVDDQGGLYGLIRLQDCLKAGVS